MIPGQGQLFSPECPSVEALPIDPTIQSHKSLDVPEEPDRYDAARELGYGVNPHEYRSAPAAREETSTAVSEYIIPGDPELTAELKKIRQGLGGL